jgi:3-hydroxybutyrate dehydrogenase
MHTTTLDKTAVHPRSTRMLAGRNALVTGSTSGIGLGVAEALAAEGAGIVLNGFGDTQAIMRTRDRLAADHGVEVVYSGADLSDPAAIAEMMAYARDVMGPVDILVNNAGIQHVAPIHEFPTAKWDAIIAVNLSSAFHTIRAVLPEMVERGYGRIINVASAHGLVASPYKSAYVSAKHGILGLTKTVALEVATSQVTCNAICPGFVLTPLVENQIEEQARAHGIPVDKVVTDVLLASQPNKRFSTVDEIGALAAFLCGPGAGTITGTSLSVDGGWTAH